MNWVSVSHRRLPNLGDRICRPGLYFDLPVSESVDWLKIPDADGYLVGGGGIVRDWIVSLAAKRKRKIVAWGTGWVYRDFDLLPRPSGIDLYGSRDWGQDDADAWVPCASAMHAAFDRDYVIERDVVGYWNPDFKRPAIGIPLLLNTAGEDAVFAWLGSAETVVTNSYHGAYWAMLLGRKVVIVNAYSGKFTHFHPSMQPPVVDAKDWQTAKPVIADGALERCREVNRAFAQRVRNVMCA